MSKKVVFLTLSVPHETLLWSDSSDLSPLQEILSLESDAFAALCVAIKRAANEREKRFGYHAKLEE